MSASIRFTQEDWIVLGLTQLTAEGLGALTIDRMCAAAGRTRGSFYHHFPDHEAFIRLMMEYWEKRNTDEVIAEVEAGGVEARPDDKAHMLNVRASAINHRLEVRIRQLAQKEPVAMEVLARVDARRIDYLADLYRETYGCAREDAVRTAQLEYACYVGGQTLWPDAPPSNLEALGAAFTAMAAAGLRKNGDA